MYSHQFVQFLLPKIIKPKNQNHPKPFSKHQPPVRFLLFQTKTWLISIRWSCPVGRMVRSTLMSWGTISIHPVAMKTRLLVSKGSKTNEFSVGMLGNVWGKLPGLLVKIHRKLVIVILNTIHVHLCNWSLRCLQSCSTRSEEIYSEYGPKCKKKHSNQTLTCWGSKKAI